MMRNYKPYLQILCISLLGISALPGSLWATSQVYHWVDDQGVHHYTQNKPADSEPDFSTLTLEDSRPTDFDPEEDRYGVAEQAERMQTLRDDMEERREATRERRDRQPQPTVVQYQPAVRYGVSGWWNRPNYPRPPKPELPIEPPASRPPDSVLRPIGN